MATQNQSRLSISIIIAGLVCLVLTFINPSGITYAQVKRVLIAEQLEEPKKTKSYSVGDKLSLRSHKTGNTHSGNIIAISDSSLVLEGSEFLFSEILYIQDRVEVSEKRRGIGLILLGSSVVMVGSNLMPFSVNDNPTPVLAFSAGLAVLGGYFLWHRPVSPLSPQTGWQLRVEYVE